LSIIDELGPYKPLDQINYDELKLVIQKTVKKRLIELKYTNIEYIIECLLIQLREKQSLITMGRV
jgi:hypothetical protein